MSFPRLIPLLLVACACQPEDDSRASVSGRGGSGSAGAGVRKVGGLLGGTVTPAGNGDLAVVSDPERDLIYIIDVRTVTRRAAIRLPTGSQPTRGAEDRFGAVHVVLRGTGQVAKIGLSSGTLLGSVSVCPEPRGIAFDAATDALLVACATGELVTIPAAGSSSVRRFGTDLRDVIVSNGKVRVTSFRSAKVMELAGPETPAREFVPPSISLPPVNGNPASFEPTVAWRAVAGPDGSTVIAHQRSVEGDIDAIRSGLPPVVVPYYTNPCSSPIVRSVVTVIDQRGTATASFEVPGSLPLDLAASDKEVAVITAGNSELTRIPLGQMNGVSGGVCGPVGRSPPPRDPTNQRPAGELGQPIGIGYVGDSTLLVHSHNPARLVFYPSPTETRFTTTQVLDLEGVEDGESLGSATFHTATMAGLACASCHPEGQEDGHVWTLFGNKRRTQALGGGVSKTAPFHWKGDLSDLSALMNDTFVARMGGQPPSPEQVAAMGSFLDAVPALKVPTLDKPVDMVKGRAAFLRAGCESCHSGAAMTNSATTDVGTPGGAFQVPSLRALSRRAPYMHDGCASTVEQRFNLGCGGARHGDLSNLMPSEREDLLGYLKQL